jgi:gliding motility-associated-like protein
MIEMFRIVVLLLCLLFISEEQGYAQQENVWIFGRKAGLDFNSSPAVPIQSEITGFGEGSASVCDNTGQLLFYTDGDTLWTRNHIPMPNGMNITGLDSDSGYSATSSTSQGALIVPMPDSSNKYYLFSLSAWEQGPNLGRLYYSVVNMDLNGGFGDVEPNRRGILVDSNLSEHMTGVVGDECNVWVIVVPRFNSGQGNQFKSFEITPSGLNTTPVISTLPGLFTGYLVFGRMNVAPNRKKLAIARSNAFVNIGSLELYDFNAATGQLSNTMTLDPNYGACYGVCFSPDNLKLYVNASANNISQYDLSSNNATTIINSKTLICNASFTDIKRAPDGKIYFIANETTGKLGAINLPNIIGMACQPNLNAIQLLSGTVVHGGFPNVVPVFKRDSLFKAETVTAGCFAGSVTLIENSNGWNHIWDDGSTGTQRSVTAPGNYWVQYYTAPCVFHTDTFKVTFPGGSVPVLQIVGSCADMNNGMAWVITPTWDTITYVYNWRNAVGVSLSTTDTLQQVPSGNYTLEISTSSGCDTTLSFFLSEEQHTVNYTVDTLSCLGENLQFQNTSDSYFSDFQWYFGDNNTSQAVSPGYQYPFPGIYQVMLIGSGSNCIDTAIQNIIVDAPVSDLRFTKDKDNICTGRSIAFIPQTDSTAIHLSWSFGDGAAFDSDNETVNHAYDSTGTKLVNLIAHFRACPDISFQDSVLVHPLPFVNLGQDTFLCLNGAPIFLANMAEVSDGSHYLWNTGDTAQRLEIRHHGQYSLTVTSAYDCATTETIEVKKDCYIDIPNAFTPNGDDINDYFFPRQLLSRSVTKFSMQIFNRWGQLIFETKQTNGRGWDGRFNQASQPQGVYVYLIDVEIDGSHVEQYKGNVTLIR